MKAAKSGPRRRSTDRRRRPGGRRGRDQQTRSDRTRPAGEGTPAGRPDRYDMEYTVSLGYGHDRAIIIV